MYLHFARSFIFVVEYAHKLMKKITNILEM